VAVLEVGVGEDAVDEEQDGGGEDEVVQVAPDGAGEACAEQGRDKDEQEQVEGDGSQEVDGGLERRRDGEDDVVEAEVRLMDEEQHERMGEGERDGCVGGPVMQGEEVDMAMRPEAGGAVA